MTDLKELRNRLGLTQAQLAEKASVSETTIQNWESLKIIPRGENLNNYLDALEINNPSEREKIAGEISGVTKTDNPRVVDNIPYFLFPEDSPEISIIKNCFVTAEELDMLAYVDYASGTGRAANLEKRKGVSYPLEFAFFEKHGGYNMTRKKVSDARERLGALYMDALEFAAKNPGVDYSLASLDKTIIIDRIGKYLNKTNYQSEINDLYDCLKTIVSDGTKYNMDTIKLMMEKATIIKELLRNNYNRTTKECNLAQLTGFVELDMKDAQDVPTIKMLRLTERGKQFIQWGDSIRGIQ